MIWCDLVLQFWDVVFSTTGFNVRSLVIGSNILPIEFVQHQEKQIPNLILGPCLGGAKLNGFCHEMPAISVQGLGLVAR